MNLAALFNAIDAKPFKPFAIELVSGSRVEIEHPDNVYILPNRQSVNHIEVFGPGPTFRALIWPEGVVGLYFNGDGGGHSNS